MTLYIQEQLKGLTNKATMEEGCRLLGYSVSYLQDSFRFRLKQERDIAYGNVGWIKGLADNNELIIPLAGFVPTELASHAPSYVFDDVSNAYKAIGKFVKPHPSQQKVFNGFVVQANQPQKTMLTLAGYSGDVIIQECVEYVSEWRFIVLDHEVLDARHYKGNFRLIPDWNLADKIAKDFRGLGPAWSFDLGLTKEGKTHLIECHTMFSLGCYGTPPIFLGRALSQAWDHVWKVNKQNK